ncbi:MAG: tRNA uridine(34) 5-carboxymethylaminomethyl modification radical SAM/GNAT enzyme Elp3 [Candidatus Gracilibacteria bacterium]|nr:tRNA uridine(34) 5-carboxymethylaminomethyl modification radical SAM/GNAT enzyme Elp3 [Candidatus Gracilibacteria bacterium]
MNFDISEEIIEAVILDPDATTKQHLQTIVHQIAAKYKLADSPQLFQLLEVYRNGVRDGKYANETRILKLFRKRAVRSLSGVSVISLLTKFWGCPGKCVYCPTFDNLPKSYVPQEPAVMRAELNAFDPVLQVQNRLRSLEVTGHAIAKCDVRVIGGTWSVYPKAYKEMVMRGIYDGHTTFSELRKYIQSGESGDKLSGFKIRKGFEMIASKTLKEAQDRNETAESRVIGIAIETRPDWITPDEIRQLRVYGVTRVEIGYQTTNDTINTLNQRGHGNKESIEATRMLKDAGFKVVAHMMPNLLGSNPLLDRESMQEIFNNPDYRPDELKIYPMVVTDHSELTEIWRNGGFTAYDDATLVDLMADLEGMIPEYVRLNRSYRDIPATMILEGSKLSNLRELTAKKMVEKGIRRHDISAREIRAKTNNPHDAIMETTEYDASQGKEFLIQYIDPKDRTLFGLLRLRIPSQYFTGEVPIVPELTGCSIIREIHVFGDQLPIGAPPDGSGQHMGFGKKLLAEAERIVREHYPKIEKMAVISGTGVRPYYRKFGYEICGEYMTKVM